MYFRMLHDEAIGAMSYLLADLEAGEAALIDPRGADVPVLRAMLDERALRLRWVLRTHEHDALLGREPAALAALEAPVVQSRLPADSSGALVLGHEHLQVLATPGHTAGCLSFLWRDRLFCGGLLSADACPHQPQPALPEAMWHSVMHRVFTLPGETLLFGAHVRHGRAVSQVIDQRRWHPWFGGVSRDEFLALVRGQTSASPTTPPTFSSNP
jgi:sulfur dioxygenase